MVVNNKYGILENSMAEKKEVSKEMVLRLSSAFYHLVRSKSLPLFTLKATHKDQALICYLLLKYIGDNLINSIIGIA
jgi:hypothetical protein